MTTDNAAAAAEAPRRYLTEDEKARRLAELEAALGRRNGGDDHDTVPRNG
jgi:hypothetical protein